TLICRARTCPANTPADDEFGSVALPVSTPGVPPWGRKFWIAVELSNFNVKAPLQPPPMITGLIAAKLSRRNAAGLPPRGGAPHPPCVTVTKLSDWPVINITPAS